MGSVDRSVVGPGFGAVKWLRRLLNKPHSHVAAPIFAQEPLCGVTHHSAFASRCEIGAKVQVHQAESGRTHHLGEALRALQAASRAQWEASRSRITLDLHTLGKPFIKHHVSQASNACRF